MVPWSIRLRVSFLAIILIALITLILVLCKIMESFFSEQIQKSFFNNQFNSLLQHDYTGITYELMLGF